MNDPNPLQSLAKAIRMFGTHAFEASNTNHKPFAESLVERMRSPKTGDLVFEVTTAYRSSDADHLIAVGFLVDQTEDASLIHTLDGRNEEWRGALFHAIPHNKDFDDEKQAPISEGLSPLQRLATIIRIFGNNAYDANIWFDGRSYDLYQRMLHPAVGDLVVEQTAAWRVDDSEHIHAVGYLLEQGEAAGLYSTEFFTRILTLDGREERWTNARFVALPSERQIANIPRQQ
jgi:hypothetical protein